MKCALTLLTALLLLKTLAVGLESSALSPKRPIRLTNVEGRMDDFSVDVKGQRLFVAAPNHTIEVIDLRVGRQVQTIRNLHRGYSTILPRISCLSRMKVMAL